MNPRVAKLLTSANAVRRRIWASLPFKVRLAEMLMRLAVSSSEAFGRAVYGIFKKQGVVGLPESMSDLTREAKDFGSLVFKTLMGKFGAQLGAGVEDVMSAFMLRLLKGGEHNIKAGTSLDEARGIVMLGVKNEALNHVKSRKRRQPFEQGLMKPGDEGEKEIDMNDPHALNKLEDAVGERFLFEKLRHIKNDLEKVHEDALLYLKLLLVDGYEDKEIVGDPRIGLESMLPHPFTTHGKKPLTPQSWNAIKKQLLAVLRDKLGDELQVAFR